MAFSVLEQIENHQGLIDVKTLAKYFGVRPNAVYVWIAKGKIPTLNAGLGAVKFDPRTLSYWLRKRNPIMAQAEREGRPS